MYSCVGSVFPLGGWAGSEGGGHWGTAAPKKLCIFSPLFSHRRDETASDIDPDRAGSYATSYDVSGWII